MKRRSLQILTTSEIASFRACPQLHAFRYRLGYERTEKASALYFGTIMHVALDAWFTGHQEGIRGQDLLTRALATLPEEMDPFERAKAEVMLVAYHLRWVDEPMTVLAVEVEFRTPILNPETGAPSRTFELAGKIDAIIEWQGRVVVVEHKTSGEEVSMGSDYWKRLRLDPQVSNYFMGGKALGYDIQGCLYDVLKKPTIRKSVTDTVDTYRARAASQYEKEPERFIVRGEVVRLEDDERAAAWDLWHNARAIREADAAGCHPRNPQSCVRYNRTCEFFEVCTREASLEDESRFKLLPNVHPELAA